MAEIATGSIEGSVNAEWKVAWSSRQHTIIPIASVRQEFLAKTTR